METPTSRQAQGTLTQIVNQDSTTTSVVSSTNPSVYGQSVTFTATVAANALGSGTPTGSVTFANGLTTLGTITLSGGTATYTTAKLPTGQGSITATYNASSGFSHQRYKSDPDRQPGRHDRGCRLFVEPLALRPIGDIHSDGKRKLAGNWDAHGNGHFLQWLNVESAPARLVRSSRAVLWESP